MNTVPDSHSGKQPIRTPLQFPPQAGGRQRLHEQAIKLLGADAWVDSGFAAASPRSGKDVALLLSKMTCPIIVAGSGSEIPDNFQPSDGALVILTNRLTEPCDLSEADQTLTVGAGRPVAEVNRYLNDSGYQVPALARFERGTVGGRLASVSSRSDTPMADGWTQSLLGISVVLSDGTPVTYGGRCIKDVAGYDLRHIFTGSRGSIGVIVEAIFRVQPAGVKMAINPPKTAVPKEFNPSLKALFDPPGRMLPAA